MRTLSAHVPAGLYEFTIVSFQNLRPHRKIKSYYPRRVFKTRRVGFYILFETAAIVCRKQRSAPHRPGLLVTQVEAHGPEPRSRRARVPCFGPVTGKSGPRANFKFPASDSELVLTVPGARPARRPNLLGAGPAVLVACRIRT